ncbi:hypothetical protein BDV38DRAFT_270057 [Aspergillus pseudotamarii]|uniref:Zn(2)-C6 fungal-type domain-containing protein n=1 Tax=Aspergillus pseudotamarii TaxID=132259 RepID=A0A5N6SZL9_ASPPS|nr:uncharacterized protein BDV38DRAFT_270057 [Aspergillus pseudotamarii]KAE8139201.1 hypothetical protein BDV38DRAFT_270057 [Aspergillus pseudotamarii]
MLLSIQRLDFEALSEIPDRPPSVSQGALLFLLTLVILLLFSFFFWILILRRFLETCYRLPWLPWRCQYPDGVEPIRSDPRRAAVPAGKNTVKLSRYNVAGLTAHCYSARHIKCDESPGNVCQNCTSTGRICEGYDMCRLPHKRTDVCLPDIANRLCWIMNSDEKRCFSYFHHHSISSLISFFDSPLWQKLIRQLSHTEPAVYHAVNVLGAVQEDSEENDMRLAGVNLYRPRHRFALEQSARSYALLNKRHASHDPQLKEVTLLLLGQYNSALRHLRSGLKILNEAPTYTHCLSAIDQSLVEAFVRLDAQSSHFGADGPLLHLNKEGEEAWSHSDTMPLPRNVQEARRELNHVLSKGIPFLSECWARSSTEIRLNYDSMHFTQQNLLASLAQHKQRFELFCEESYATLSPKEQRGAGIIRLHYLAQILSIKTCFFHGPIPGYLTPEYVSLLSAHEALMVKFPERSTTTLDNGIIPGLYVVASKCPDYRSWPHCEGLINSNIAASLALESLKRELMEGNKSELSLIIGDNENMLHTGR